MARTIICNTTDVITLDEYIEHVTANVDVRDPDSIAESAPMLRALANDRELVVRQLNAQIKRFFRGDTFPSAQAVFLGMGTDFYVRANLWPSSADVASGRVYQEQFAYHIAHDHNYNFMTVGYYGPGYVTEIYEYDRDKVEGYIGEQVEFRYLETVHFKTGMVMQYRASEDMHIQYPPDDLSISLNLMVSTPEVRTRDQYFFDADKRTLMRFPHELDGSRRISLIELAGYTGNGESAEMLQTIARQHPCRRTRLTALEAMERLLPDEAERIWAPACGDRERLVSRAAERRLAQLGGGRLTD